MAMTKKEIAEMQSLRIQLDMALAFRFTEHVEKDVHPPKGWNELSTGWVYNAYNKNVTVACSSSIYHGIGRVDETNAQKPIRMYSSKLKAYKALRYELERKFAEELAGIDRIIKDLVPTE